MSRRKDVDVLAPESRGEAIDIGLIQSVCRRIGYGRVMQIASESWRRVDPMGAISMGPCFGMLENKKERKRSASAEARALHVRLEKMRDDS